MNWGWFVDLAAEMVLGLVDAIDIVREKYYVLGTFAWRRA
jgi:hypothetical protein